jgi:hypothetical protein
MAHACSARRVVGEDVEPGVEDVCQVRVGVRGQERQGGLEEAEKGQMPNPRSRLRQLGAGGVISAADHLISAVYQLTR